MLPIPVFELSVLILCLLWFWLLLLNEAEKLSK